MNSNPYVEARREWDERYADLVLGKRNWQIAAGGLLLLSLILAGGVVWQSTRSRFIPYVVEVDKLGYGLTLPKPLIPSTDPGGPEYFCRRVSLLMSCSARTAVALG